MSPAIREFFALQSGQPDLRLASRGVLGLAVPFALGQALALPALTWVGVAAFLLAFGDLAGGKGQFIRLVMGTLLGAVAVASGVVAGGHVALAAAGMFVWGAGIGLAGVYGEAAATMALPVAWAYLEVGLTSPSHALADAARLGALFAVGGAWAIVLAWAIKAVRPYGPVRQQTAHCFTLIAAYLESVGVGDNTHPTSYEMAPETAIRASIARARSLASHRRVQQQAMSRVAQRLVMLIELADRGFSLAGALSECIERNHTPAGAADRFAAAWREQLAAGARAVARVLTRRPDEVAERQIAVGLEQLATAGPSNAGKAPGSAASADDLSDIGSQIAIHLGHALSIARGDVLPPGLSPTAGPSAPSRVSDVFAPLRDCLDRSSVVGRHALRYGLVVAAGVAIDKGFDPPFGYWIPLTASVVLKPYAGSTLTRAGQRLFGTGAGITVGVGIMAFATTASARAVLASAAIFLTLAVLPLNYGLAIFFLSVGIVPLEAQLVGAVGPEVGLLRLLDTLVGGALALGGGYLLWPSFERRSLPALISATLSSMARYADLVLGLYARGPVEYDVLEGARRRVGVDTTNVQAALQRVASELAREPAYLAACLLAIATLQRLFVSLTALREIRSKVDAARDVAALREYARRVLEELAARLTAGRPAHPIPTIAMPLRTHAPDDASRHRLLAYEIERVTLQVRTLEAAVGRMVGPAERALR